MRNKIILGIVVGLVIGVLANPLMPPAFFILGGMALWWTHTRPGRPSASPSPDAPSPEPRQD